MEITFANLRIEHQIYDIINIVLIIPHYNKQLRKTIPIRKPWGKQ